MIIGIFIGNYGPNAPITDFNRKFKFIPLIGRRLNNRHDLTFMLVGCDDLSILTSKASECVRCCDSCFIGPPVKLDYSAVLEFGIWLLPLIMSSVPDEGATSSTCLMEAFEPDGLMIAFSCPTALPLPASSCLNKSSASIRDLLLLWPKVWSSIRCPYRSPSSRW